MKLSVAHICVFSVPELLSIMFDLSVLSTSEEGMWGEERESQWSVLMRAGVPCLCFHRFA